MKQVVNGELIEVEDTEIEDEGTPEVKEGEETTDTEADDETPLWLQTDEDEGEDKAKDEGDSDEDDDDDDDDKKAKDDDKKVSVRKHIHMKQKLKARASEKEKENEALREENEALKLQLRSTAPVEKKKLVRPKPDDFDTYAEYEVAQDKYEKDLFDQRLEEKAKQEQFEASKQAYIKTREVAVDEHYDRAAKLIDSSKIDPDVYKSAEDKVYLAAEEVLPKLGNATVDHMITMMGDGSEKVLYYIGRNKKVLDEFKSTLSNDKTGLAVSLFIGKLLERLTSTKNKTSQARPPAKDVVGDKITSKGERAMFKKYEAAHKNGKTQEAFNIRRQAKLKGIDVSAWSK